MTATIVTCTKRKRAGQHPARDLYSPSPLFRRCLRQALADGHPVFVLSTKYGLVEPATVIRSYERDLTAMTARERSEWVAQLQADVRRLMVSHGISRAVFLASRAYREAAKPAFTAEGIRTYVHRHWNRLSA
ncbi:MAG: DUF6884 domain-containing protein [Vicinamibacterales bacterium]